MDVDVTKLQEALMLCGFYPGTVDGKMGPRTKAALTEFQKGNGLAADGIFGPKSAAAIAGKLGEASSKALTLLPYFATLK